MFPPHAQHGNAGRTPANRTSDKTVARLVEIIGKYTRTDPTRGFLSCCNPNFAGPAGLLRAMAQEATEEYESIQEITALRILREYIRRCVGEQRRCTQLGEKVPGAPPHSRPTSRLALRASQYTGIKNLALARARSATLARSLARSRSRSRSRAALSLSGALFFTAHGPVTFCINATRAEPRVAGDMHDAAGPQRVLDL